MPVDAFETATPRTHLLDPDTVEKPPKILGIADSTTPPDSSSMNARETTNRQCSPKRTSFRSLVATVSFSPTDAPSQHSAVDMAPKLPKTDNYLNKLLFSFYFATY